MKPKLRFYAEGSALVADLEAQDAGVRRFVGMRLVEVPGEGNAPKRHGFESTGQVHEVPYRTEYVREANHGHLRPADEATAIACGMPFREAPAAKDQATASNADWADPQAKTTSEEA